MQICKECFMNIMASFVLPKGSPYTTSVSEGYVRKKVVHHLGGKMMIYVCRIIEMNAFGLIDYWIASYTKKPYQCLTKKRGRQRQELSRLSLKNCTGAFIVLLFGIVVSFLVLIVELLLNARQLCSHQ